MQRFVILDIVVRCYVQRDRNVSYCFLVSRYCYSAHYWTCLLCIFLQLYNVYHKFRKLLHSEKKSRKDHGQYRKRNRIYRQSFKTCSSYDVTHANMADQKVQMRSRTLRAKLVGLRSTYSAHLWSTLDHGDLTHTPASAVYSCQR